MKGGIAVAALVVGMSACASNPQRLPVGLSLCNAVAQPRGFTVAATVQNASDRPISNLGLAVSFYRDFRYTSYTASVHLAKELDPQEKRDVRFDGKRAFRDAAG